MRVYGVLRRGICGSIRDSGTLVRAKTATAIDAHERAVSGPQNPASAAGDGDGDGGGGGGGGSVVGVPPPVRPNGEARRRGQTHARTHIHTNARTPYQMTSAVRVYTGGSGRRRRCAGSFVRAI